MGRQKSLLNFFWDIHKRGVIYVFIYSIKLSMLIDYVGSRVKKFFLVEEKEGGNFLGGRWKCELPGALAPANYWEKSSLLGQSVKECFLSGRLSLRSLANTSPI